MAATDLLVPHMGELIGGSAREDDHDRLHERMTDSGLNVSQYDWYLDLRRHGMCVKQEWLAEWLVS